MAQLRISVGSLGLAMLGVLGISCSGSVADDSPAAGGRSGTGGTSGGNSGASGGGSSTGASGGAIQGGAVATGGTGTLPPVCQVISTAGGLESCVGGWSHRRDPQACASQLPRPGTTCVPSGTLDNCSTDGQCTTSLHGYCMSSASLPGCYCNYGCVTDSECGAGAFCACGDPIGHCVGATCVSDADCAPGLCASYDASPGCGFVGYACTTPLDECKSGQDCATGYCGLASDGHRTCVPANCAIGRPFLVDGEDRLAPVEQRSGWLEAQYGVFEGVQAAAQRQRLAAYYARVGQMEHAAVAAFARLTMQLMSLGAPSELVEQSIRAQRDEVAHARLAFALASELTGAKLGPGALCIDGSMHETSAAHIAYTTVIEGCVGETLAALEAAELRERAGSPRLRALFDQIAEDEARHAQLAWRVAAWLLQTGDASVHRAVAHAFELATTRSHASRQVASEDAEYGALDDTLAGEIRTQAIAQVILPAARDLLATHASGNAAHDPPLAHCRIIGTVCS